MSNEQHDKFVKRQETVTRDRKDALNEMYNDEPEFMASIDAIRKDKDLMNDITAILNARKNRE